MLRKPFSFVIFSVLVSKHFGLSANWKQKKDQIYYFMQKVMYVN